MTGEDWIDLAQCFQAEHTRLWEKYYPQQMESARFALQLQSYAMICYDMANRVEKRKAKK